MTFSIKFCFSRFMTGTNYEWRAVGGTCFADTGSRHSFGYPGGAIMPVYDALYDGGVEHLLCRHEQGAAMAAIGYARATGKTGCIATSGPGATNLITRRTPCLTLFPS